MPGKINLYNLGNLGVNRVKSPVHLIDGELLQAQNAVYGVLANQQGINKRPGIDRLSTTASGGEVFSLINIPFPGPPTAITTIVRVYLDDGSSTWFWETSTDGGATWSTPVLLAVAPDLPGINVTPALWRALGFFDSTGGGTGGGALYYPASNETDIRELTPTGDSLKVTLPNGGTFQGWAFGPSGGGGGGGACIYVLTALPDGLTFQVVRYDVATFTPSDFCDSFSVDGSGDLVNQQPMDIALWDTKVWVPSFEYNNAGFAGHHYIYRANSDSLSWTLDDTLSYPWVNSGGRTVTPSDITVLGGAGNHLYLTRNYEVAGGPNPALDADWTQELRARSITGWSTPKTDTGIWVRSLSYISQYDRYKPLFADTAKVLAFHEVRDLGASTDDSKLDLSDNAGSGFTDTTPTTANPVISKGVGDETTVFAVEYLGGMYISFKVDTSTGVRTDLKTSAAPILLVQSA